MRLKNHFQKYTLTSDQSSLLVKLEQFLDSSNSQSNVFLLKGYAGTGKTFITKGLTEYFRGVGQNCVLAAPTGKAAKVIQEKTGSEAYTIHKTIYGDKIVEKSETNLVEYKNDELDRTYKFYFDLRVNEDSVDTVYIFDEASMISNIYSEMEFIRFGSGHLLQDLIRYINLDQNDHRKKIIFIGDNAQLPPVGMNFSPALDEKYLLDKFGLEVTEFELKEVMRQKENSGILKNASKLRNSLEAKIFNQLDLDTEDDVTELASHELMPKYLDISGHKISKDAMVISYTNASVTEYNQQIRKHFFQDSSQIQINDKIMVLSNNSNYDIFLSNGDFGMIRQILGNTEHKTVQLKRKNEESGIVEKIDIDLYFRDVVILFKDINNKPHEIKCKIVENLLFSESPGLNSDENKAIYLDFVMRNSHLKPNTKAFTEAIRNDPYFNALKVKFGYAITCHKAQGSEWKHVFLNCKTHQSYLSDGYFRWLYTALTRAAENLYLINAPHLGMFDGFKKNHVVTEHIIEKTQHTVEKNANIDNVFQIQDPFLLLVYQKVVSLLQNHTVEIVNVAHNQYQEQYTFKNDQEATTIIFYYNGKNLITNIQSVETNALSSQLKDLFASMKKHVLGVVNGKEEGFEFPEKFLETYYDTVKNTIETIGAKVGDIEHKNWMERYMFTRDDEVAIIDFYYNGKGQFKSPTPNNKSNSAVLISEILGVLQ
jgi:hypothetical protein